MVFKCKICGGQTTVDSKDGVAVCDYCGTKQALPLFTDDSEKLLYESGNNYLLHSEYDKAENVFNQLLTIKPNAAELYWDLVLCKFGVTYVKDPKTEKYIPTCNRTHYTPIFSDANYIKAVELSTGEKKALFEEDAKTIDNIQKGIIAVSKKEKPFDIFISYKETDSNGDRTKDSIEAQKLYEKLTQAGYKVFFSRITLEDKVGTEYEPYIYAALYSSKVMLTICSSKENIEAVWVKNEWGRFLSLQQKDADKTLIPLYFDMDRAELPDEFSIIPAFDIKEDGFEDELLRGIKKQIPLPIMLAQKRKARKKTALITLLSILSVLIVIGVVFLPGAIKNYTDSNKYEEAMQLFENQKYSQAKVLFQEIVDFENSKYMIERCDRQPDYDAAQKLYIDGKYAQAAWAFKAIADYEDAADMQKKAETSWRKSVSTVSAENYYISENGTVSTLKGAAGSAHNKVDISENGKVSSIQINSFYTSYYSDLVTLHENGRVEHPYIDSHIADDPQFNDIIKVSGALNTTMGLIGLRADGKMVSFYQEEEFNFGYLDALSEWSDIVDFKYNYQQGNGLTPGLVVGLKSDGTMCAIQVATGSLENLSTYYDMHELQRILSQFTNVRSFSINPYGAAGMRGLEIVAITYDNKMLTYLGGVFTQLDGKDICDVVTTDIVLKTNGDLVDLNSNKVLARDIVYAGEYLNGSWNYGFAVTRNGNINTISYEDVPQEVVQTESKTLVHEEWLLRLD